MQALFDKKTRGALLAKLDVRTKLGVTAMTAILTLTLSSLAAQIIIFVATLLLALLLRRPKLLAVVYGSMLFMMILATGFGMVLIHFMPGMKAIAISELIIPFLRGASMTHVVLVLAYTTRVENVISVLESMRLPFWLFLPAAVMLRFIPVFVSDVRQVWESMRIRGWHLGVGMVLAHPLVVTRLVLIPVLFRALKSSETLGVAAELKGLGATERTLKVSAATSVMHSRKGDYMVALLTVAVVAFSILAQIELADIIATSSFTMR